MSKTSLTSSTQKILLIDDSSNPSHALHYSKYILKNTSNQILVLLLSSKSGSKSQSRKKHTDSESEKRLDFDEDFKNKSQIKLEALANGNSNNLIIISEADDKNYIENFEETTKNFTGSGGFEWAIDLR